MLFKEGIMQKYEVLRPMQGDKFYNVGDVRELAESDAQGLLKHGAIRVIEKEVATKVEAAPTNKMMKNAKNV